MQRVRVLSHWVGTAIKKREERLLWCFIYNWVEACLCSSTTAGVILPCRVTHHGQTTEQEASLCMELMGKQVMALEVGCSSTPNEGRDPGHRKLQRKNTCTCMLTWCYMSLLMPTQQFLLHLSRSAHQWLLLVAGVGYTLLSSSTCKLITLFCWLENHKISTSWWWWFNLWRDWMAYEIEMKPSLPVPSTGVRVSRPYLQFISKQSVRFWRGTWAQMTESWSVGVLPWSRPRMRKTGWESERHLTAVMA